MNKKLSKSDSTSTLKIYLWVVAIMTIFMTLTFLFAYWTADLPTNFGTIMRTLGFLAVFWAILPGTFAVYVLLDSNVQWVKKAGCALLSLVTVFSMAILLGYAAGLDPFSVSPS